MKQLLEYLIKAYERDWDIKKSLEDNASKLILTSGIIIPIFFGLVLISDKSLDIVQIFFLLSVIFFGMMSIRYAINLIRPTSFSNIVDINKFIDTSTGELDNISISKFENRDEKEFEEYVIQIYIKMTDSNRKENNRLAMILNKSFRCLKFSLLFIFLFVLSIFFF
ncbi:MAG TPA: hypothetical protein VJP58_02155 [Candidatus Nitrosocosmicus sp.]|nr:hypothetical protein [Candidatus Nitrosocosmicus sp.]